MNTFIGPITLFATLVLAACGQGPNATTDSPNLKLSVSQCKGQSTAPPPPPPGVTTTISPRPSPVKQVRWIEGTSLEVTARGEMQCGVDRVIGRYAISGSILELAYQGAFSHEGPRPACDCAYELKYTIAGLEKRDYQIILEDLGYAGAAAKWADRHAK
jgi:hypothetical protein